MELNYVLVVNPGIQSAKELLVLASSNDEQKLWVQRLSKKVAKKGYAQSTDKNSR